VHTLRVLRLARGAEHGTQVRVGAAPVALPEEGVYDLLIPHIPMDRLSLSMSMCMSMWIAPTSAGAALGGEKRKRVRIVQLKTVGDVL